MRTIIRYVSSDDGSEFELLCRETTMKVWVKDSGLYAKIFWNWIDGTKWLVDVEQRTISCNSKIVADCMKGQDGDDAWFCSGKKLPHAFKRKCAVGAITYTLPLSGKIIGIARDCSPRSRWLWQHTATKIVTNRRWPLLAPAIVGVSMLWYAQTDGEARY